jgi:transposase-like protein
MVGLEGIAWAIMGEGYIGLSLSKVRVKTQNCVGYSIKPTISISNTDNEFIEALYQSLKQYVTARMYRDRRSEGRREGYFLVVQGTRVKRLLMEIRPYLVGRKKRIADLMMEFFERFPSGNLGGTLTKRRQRFLEMMEYYDKICSLNNRTPRNHKYSKEYFVKLWGNLQDENPLYDKEKLSDLYDKYTVTEIAKRLGVSYTTVLFWMRKHGLKTIAKEKRRKKIDIKKIMEYYKKGLSDRAIGKLMGVSHQLIADRRRELGLPPNTIRAYISPLNPMKDLSSETTMKSSS